MEELGLFLLALCTIGFVVMSLCLTIFYIENKCQHEYKIIDKIDLCWEEEITGTLYVLQCTKCGKIKTKKVS